MKRLSLNLDEDMLERARRFSGETTDSGTITRVLEEVVRDAHFRELRVEWEKLAAEHPIYFSDHVEEIRPKGYIVIRRSYTAEEKRTARKRARRGSRA
jgi:hypothetical protein